MLEIISELPVFEILTISLSLTLCYSVWRQNLLSNINIASNSVIYAYEDATNKGVKLIEILKSEAIENLAKIENLQGKAKVNSKEKALLESCNDHNVKKIERLKLANNELNIYMGNKDREVLGLKNRVSKYSSNQEILETSNYTLEETNKILREDKGGLEKRLHASQERTSYYKKSSISLENIVFDLIINWVIWKIMTFDGINEGLNTSMKQLKKENREYRDQLEIRSKA